MKKLFSAIALSIAAGQAQAGAILLTDMGNNFNGGTEVYLQMKGNLESAGHTVDIVDATVAGNLASALGSGSYDQLFLWDLTEFSYLNTADINAVSSFWDPTMGVVVDTRSYGYYFQGDDPSEVALLGNVAEALDLSGGGLWVGSDHAPNWTRNANPVLSALGFNPITGSYGDPVNFADPSSFLLQGVTPTDLWAAGQTVGQAPTGLQPNGVEMFLHFGHTQGDNSVLSYISASFDLEGPDGEPNPVPLPGTLALIGLGLLGMVGRRRR